MHLRKNSGNEETSVFSVLLNLVGVFTRAANFSFQHAGQHPEAWYVL